MPINRLPLLAIVPFAATFVAAPLGAQHDTATSPDGRLRATIRTEKGEGGASGEAPTSLWLTDTRTGRSRMLFRGHSARDARHDTARVANPRFSLDGGHVYVEADAYATSPAIHQVAVRTGAERYVADGGLVGVIRNGPWRGFLIVEQHRYRDGGGSYDPVVVLRPDGQRVATVPGSDRTGDRAVAPWLRAKGWRAS